MAVRIADAYVPIRLDTSQIDAQLSAIEARIAAIQGQARSASQAASSAASAMASAGGGGAAGGGGFFGGISDRIQSMMPDSIAGVDISGFGTLPESIRQATSAGSSSGRGFSLGEDIGASLRLLGARGKGFFEGPVGEAATAIGDSLMGGAAKGVNDGSSGFSQAMRDAVNGAIKAGQDEAEIRSPSARSMREIGSPIMRGIELEVMAGGKSVADAMITSIDFAFQSSINSLFGGATFSRNNNTIVGGGDGQGGPFSGVPDYLDQFGNAVRSSMAVGNPQSAGQASRILASNFPTKVRDFGQGLLSSAVGSVLPGFAAGPISDMLGTMIGTKPILTAEQALAGPVSADAGGLSDSPFTGGQFVFNNNFNGAGNFMQTEREVQSGILQSMRRLGIGF